MDKRQVGKDAKYETVLWPTSLSSALFFVYKREGRAAERSRGKWTRQCINANVAHKPANVAPVITHPDCAALVGPLSGKPQRGQEKI